MNTIAALGLKVSLVLSVLAGGGGVALAALAGTPTAGVAAHPDHSTQALPAALRPVFYQTLAKDAGVAYAINKSGCAMLPKQDLKGCFDSTGAHFTGTTLLSLHLVAWGRGNDLASITAVQPVVKANQASYPHGNLTEWWRVLPVGFEQGFTIAKRPSGSGELTLTLAATRQAVGTPPIRHSRVGGNPVKTSPSIPLRSEGGKEIAWGKLRYADLVVTDAKGKVVPATLKSKGDRVLIAVNDAHAIYPLTVDPLVWLEQKVTASDGAAGDEFGYSVAAFGAHALIGVPFAGINFSAQGAAYVFDESNGIWTQTTKLTASDGAAFDEFGYSVALAGTTALIGARYATINGNPSQGAAYVFSESNGTWTQTAKLTASDGAIGDQFGWSVALGGTTALIGANDATVGDNYEQGAAYLFNKSNGIWTQTAKLTASDGATYDRFGTSVVFSGTTALIGAPSNEGKGAAYLFGKSNGTWTQTQKLAASDGETNDAFGVSVALSGPTALAGADDATVNGNVNQGAAYVFSESNGTWTQTQKLTASGGAANDQFGFSVAIDGTTALVGAPNVTINNNYSEGSVYEFEESNGSWTQTTTLTPSDGAASDLFGWSVALSTPTAVVGAVYVTVNDNYDQGAAYFEGESDLDLAVSAPQSVQQGQRYTSETIATNNASGISPAVSATITVPAAASFVSATATQGTCSEASGLVTCDFGAIEGNAGTATANVTLEATGNVGDTIENTASLARATPLVTASAPTEITACPDGYTEYDDSLDAGKHANVPPYESPAGEQNAILTAPAGFRLYVLYQKGSRQKLYRIPGNEVHRHAPAGTFTWAVKAGNDGGAYTLCLLHP